MDSKVWKFNKHQISTVISYVCKLSEPIKMRTAYNPHENIKTFDGTVWKFHKQISAVVSRAIVFTNQ